MPTPKNNTLCWMCKNAVPLMENEEYVRGCNWSKWLQPVEGWVATETRKVSTTNQCEKYYIVSYKVVSCPEYEADDERRGHENIDCL